MIFIWDYCTKCLSSLSSWPWMAARKTRCPSLLKSCCHSCWSVYHRLRFNSLTMSSTRLEDRPWRSSQWFLSPMKKNSCLWTALMNCKFAKSKFYPIFRIDFIFIFSLIYQILFSLLLVIERDNEENAELAIKMFYDMQRFYRNTFFVLVRPSLLFNFFFFRVKCQEALSASLRLFQPSYKT